MMAITQARHEIIAGKITDFRMKIRGIHKLAFGGQRGGRNDEIKKNGFTVIKMTGQKMKRDIIESPVDNNRGIAHPAIFPLKVIKEMVLLLSPKNGIVLDPFCGSGTSCLAAKELNRNYIGIDLSDKFCKISRERLNDGDKNE
ncbi:MAG: site-specific DNA-methyltransferase [Clostridiales bacterium]|nr:site-specific DNA-methyltransferase [Clostridiales bacterium]